MTDNSVSVTLQNDVTYVDETHNKRQKGGTVKIYGKTKFHLEAPLTKNLGIDSSSLKIVDSYISITSCFIDTSIIRHIFVIGNFEQFIKLL